MVGPTGFYAQPSYVESVSSVTLTNSVQLGAVRMEGGEEYVYVYNDGGASAAVGFAMVPQSGSSGYSVTVTSVTGVGVAMGFVKHATFTTAAYAWVLTKGYCPSVKNAQASTAVVSGDVLALAANGAVQLHTGALTTPVLGIAISATGSAGVFSAFVRCFGS